MTNLEAFKKLMSRSLAVPSGCIQWQRGKDKDGYGIIWAFGKHWRAHRLAWFLAKGFIPKGLMVLHQCDNTSCVNAAHLFLGTALTNKHDCIQKGRAKFPVGDLNGQAKLTSTQVLAIRARYVPRSQGNNMYDIAKDYGVSVTAVHAAIRRKKWKSA